MSDVFVSYARDDRGRVEQLAKALEARGFNVWWDPELLPGEQYAQKISKVLSDCKAVLVVWSNASAARSWVLDEASVGRDRGVLVPVLIEQIEAPLGFRQMQAEDLSSWPHAGADNFERVVRALEGLLGVPGAPRPPGPGPHAAHAQAPAFVSEPPQRGNRFLIYAGIAALIVLAAVAFFRITNGGGAQTAALSSAAPAGGHDVSDSYGLTKSEIANLDMKPLVLRALSQTSIEKIEQGANGGDILSQILMCGAHDWGLGGLAKNENLARPWCEQAAAQGSTFANFYLGLFHVGGNAGFAKDLNAGHQLIEDAAKAGDSRALAELGHLYQDGGEGYPQDDFKALDYYRQSAQHGNQDGQFSTAWMYENGRGTAKDYATALVWYQKLADEGSPMGTRAVGFMYYNGWSIDRDVVKAREYWEKASAMGDGPASYDLGLLYENGNGVDKDVNKALDLYRLAQAQGYADADAAVKRLTAAQTTP